MSYLVGSSKIHRITINGEDYTSQLVSWQASDSSCYKQGLVTTQGQVVLAGVQGGPYMTDYDRNNFKRGQEVILEIKTREGDVVRHPRGLLYVITNSYNVETEEMTIQLGCQIDLAQLTENYEALLPLAPLPLDPLRRDAGAVSQSLASAGMYAFQNNAGELVSDRFFGNDTTESHDFGEWVSVLGRTSLSVQPLAGTKPIPDSINLAYNSLAGDNTTGGKVDITTTESYYFITYPATYYQRTGNGLGSITGVIVTAPSSGQSSSCGNTPPAPGGSTAPAPCNDGYELQQQPLVLPAEKLETQRTEYNGPAGQVSRVYSERRGPALEANSQYFADQYAYCRYTWSTACNPNGSCSTEDGMQDILLGYTEQINEYGGAGELLRTITDTYATTLSGAQPFDWRSGNINGVPQDFQTMSVTDMYRVTRVINEIFVENNSNVQETTTYTSVTQNGAGLLSGEIDALNGVQTFQRRRSVTISANPTAPDNLNSPEAVTSSSSTSILLYNGRFTDNPEEAGPLVQKEQVPVPLLLPTREETDEAVQEYSEYLTRFIKGDAYGLQIAEGVHSKIIEDWKPGMPFRYYDAPKGLLMAMRMDACAWTADSEGVGVATNGIWIGYSDGDVTGGRILSGDSTPDGQGSSSAPAAQTGEYRVINETYVDTGSYVWQVDVFFGTSSEMYSYGNDGVIPPQPTGPITYEHEQTFTVWITGLVLEPGGFYEPGVNGGLPTSTNGSLVTSDAVIVIGNLFSEQDENNLPSDPGGDGDTVVERGPFAINGYYPLYDTEAGANAAGDGTSHTHTFGGVTYYMPNGLTMGVDMFHGDYGQTGETSGGSEGSGSGGGGGYGY